jgi:hypothetical protein
MDGDGKEQTSAQLSDCLMEREREKPTYYAVAIDDLP